MGNWILAFEIPTVLLFLFAVGMLIKGKDYSRLSNLITAFVFGITLEYFNIFLTAGYHYHTDFLLQFGTPPTNVPIAIGLAWGMLLLTAQDVSQRLKLPLRIRLFFEAAFVVSTDIILDVIAIRLEGGFWVWEDVTTNLSITNTSFFGVGWMNFIGWYFVIFFVSLFLHLMNQKIKPNSWLWQITKVIIVPIVSYLALFGILYLINFYLFTYSWIIFLGLYLISILISLIYLLRNRPIEIEKTHSLFPLLFYLFSYLFSVIAMIGLGLVTEVLWFFFVGLLLFGITIFIVVTITDFKNLTWDAI
ncbi:carotenoid biosynthesis protein [Promethearchaeum syntrophicum]|uniref:Carotenoid biosynthesis protein n=1 Tax=Promethearchaeum syntrophicum TaxID=2594042 RepID=A0A5B9DDB4_9ARCH|nr:carotenoid biosynthesis protein [Candidatus Prometheoarchaeum syntrophicum]QEE17114.1 hypothetical protein DSAG12_02946 [Candidatus Prometheoarchaeum syntrophicum]